MLSVWGLRLGTFARGAKYCCGATCLERACIRQHTSVYVSIRQHTSAYVSIRQHTSAYVSIRQHTAAYVIVYCCGATCLERVPAYVSIRQHTSAYVSIRQHTSAYAARHALSACLPGFFVLLASVLSEILVQRKRKMTESALSRAFS